MTNEITCSWCHEELEEGEPFVEIDGYQFCEYCLETDAMDILVDKLGGERLRVREYDGEWDDADLRRKIAMEEAMIN